MRSLVMLMLSIMMVSCGGVVAKEQPKVCLNLDKAAVEKAQEEWSVSGIAFIKKECMSQSNRDMFSCTRFYQNAVFKRMSVKYQGIPNEDLCITKSDVLVLVSAAQRESKAAFEEEKDRRALAKKQ